MSPRTVSYVVVCGALVAAHTGANKRPCDLSEADLLAAWTAADWIARDTLTAELERDEGEWIMEAICQASTPTGYHSKDMVTVENGADEPATILCGYHELRRLMRQGAAQRAQRATAGSAGSGGPGGWW